MFVKSGGDTPGIECSMSGGDTRQEKSVFNVWYFGTEANVFSEGYTYPDIMKDMDRIIFVPKTDLGIKIKIPGTSLGIGAHYMMNKYNGTKIRTEGDRYSTVTYKNIDYHAVGSVRDAYKYDAIGFSLYYLMKK